MSLKAKKKKKKSIKRPNVDHFVHQYHTKKSGGVGPHTNKKKLIPRKRKNERITY